MIPQIVSRNVMVTPHINAYTYSAKQNIKDFLEGLNSGPPLAMPNRARTKTQPASKSYVCPELHKSNRRTSNVLELTSIPS